MGNSTRFIDLLIFFTILFVAINIQIKGQSFQNFRIQETEDTLYVSYDIFGGREYDLYKITMAVSSNGGKSYEINPINSQGDIGFGISRGLNKNIWWEPLKDDIELNGNNIIVKLSGEVLGTSDDIEFVSLNGNEFIMGDSFAEGFADETVVHNVRVSSFEISKYEVTNHQFAKFLNQYGSIYVKSGEFKGEQMINETPRGLKFIQGEWQPEAGFEYHPVIGISWYGANEFCRYYGYRLPTEAEWEFAARQQGEVFRFGNGKNIASTKEINFNGTLEDSIDFFEYGENRGMTINVGGCEPNLLGLFQMSGNVWEWCQDWYQLNYYLKAPKDDPAGPYLGKYKVIRGGSWFNDASGVRVTERSFISPDQFKLDIGFRPVRDLDRL